MEKEIVVTGVNGEFKGKVVVLLNYSTEPYMRSDPVNHEEYPARRTYHHVQAWIGDSRVSDDKTPEEDKVLTMATNAENELIAELKSRANRKPKLSVSEELQRKGYK